MLMNRGCPQKIAGKRWLSSFTLFLFLMLYPISLTAQEHKDYLTIKVVEIGPGDEFFSWFGHLMIIADNDITGRSFCYDFGVFWFDDPDMVCNFLKGDLNYEITVSNAQYELGWYINNNRDITLYTLNLDIRQKEKIAGELNWNVLSENSSYHYKIFTDNCVTRIISIIDDALKNEFTERYKNEKGRFTLRDNAGRYLYRSVFLYVLLNFIIGEEIDKPSSRYEEMYLPSEFTAALVDFTYTDINGNIQPLVSGIEKISTAVGRPAVLSKPPQSALYAFFAGMTLAVFFILLIIFRKKNRLLHIVFYVSQSLMALCLSVIGTVVFYAMFFSHHIYTYNNLNIVYANPLLFIGVPLGILCVVIKQENKFIFYSRILKALWTYILIGAFVTIILRITGINYTDNTVILLLLIPPIIVLSLFSFPCNHSRPVS
jgi:hypothetical protein